MPSKKAWVQRPRGLIKVEGSASTFMREYLDKVRECFMEAKIDNWIRYTSL